ncbi:hypothetical protein [Haloferax massiliensis]|uniref:C2H2-type domain-containing protein n=1 Tax=Haloferax massiliensis TaxID=1476858 RepID=A0A0D6JPL1_9EURY|nr:hypothetical protein [Haloferax massiliensis]CQR49832.1 hypothetical protein BN996_01308 [Haloferax massiliensis]
MTPQTNPHRNAEKVVKCPVDGCEAEKLSRGMHLHVLRSAGNGHGPQGEVPEHLDFENLEEVGTREVEVNYPEERKTESVARLCPYCGKPFKGKNGVLIHLGQVEGRKNHPANASEVHEPGDFPVVELDEVENVVAVVEGRIPSSAGNWPYEESVPVERVYRLIAELLAEGHPETAARARSLLLTDE